MKTAQMVKQGTRGEGRLQKIEECIKSDQTKVEEKTSRGSSREKGNG